MRNRLIQVAAVSQDGLDTRTASACVGSTWERLEQAASCRPDIVCLPENWPRSAGEPMPGAETARICDWACEHNCYVIHAVAVRQGTALHNSAIVIDRQGEVVGRYDKIHPTEGELASGIRPGPVPPPVFATDVGVVAVQICFDVNWPATWRDLKEAGAELVFFSSAYPAGRQLAMLARLYQLYIVSATRSRPSTVWDITGDPLDHSGMFRQWTAATLCLDKQLFEIDNHTSKAHAIERKYGRRVRVTWYHDEDWFTLDSLDPDISIPEITEEFGLTPLTDYIQRNTPDTCD